MKFIQIQTLARTNQDVCNEVYPNSNTCTKKSRRLQRSLSKFKHLHEQIKTSSTKTIQIQTLARTNKTSANEVYPYSNTCTNKSRRLQTKFIQIQTLARTNQTSANEVYPNSNTCTNKSRRLQRSLSKFKHLHEQIRRLQTKFIHIQTLARTNQTSANEVYPN